jgi:putative hydrolase of the HAD superfamily
MGKRLVLATNAHKLSLELKLAQTGLGCYFDALLCAHELAIPKEDPRFWSEVQGCERYEPLRTLLIDDNLAVLESARMNSIRYLYGVVQPDSGGPARESGAYPLIGDFREILPAGDPDHAASATP